MLGAFRKIKAKEEESNSYNWLDTFYGRKFDWGQFYDAYGTKKHHNKPRSNDEPTKDNKRGFVPSSIKKAAAFKERDKKLQSWKEV